MATILHVIQRVFRQLQTLAALLLLMSMSGCMSLPSPDKITKNEIDERVQEARYQISDNQPNKAIAQLLEAKKKLTDNDKLANGQGKYFKNEAQLLSVIGHLEFNRKNVPAAINYWRDSFDVEFNGWQNQQKINENNAIVWDIFTSALIGAATGGVARSSKSNSTSYFVSLPNTTWPAPAMLATGVPTNTVLRFPTRVEGAPFSNIVKLKSAKGFCTATMVSPNVAISAAHCMSTDGTASRPELMSLQRLSINPSAEMKVARYITHQGTNAAWDTKRHNDWVILVVNPEIDTTGLLLGTTYSKVVRPNSEISSGNEKIMLAGYSSDLNQGAYLTLHYGCRIKPGQNLQAGMYLTNCEDASGSSGSALMSTAPPYDIVGIHTAKVIQPKDEFSSVEIFSDQFIATLNNILGTRPTITRPIVAPAAAKNDGSAYVTPQAPSPSPLPATVEKKVQEAVVPKSAKPPSSAVEEKLKLLTNLRNRQLITEEDFQLKRKEILQGL